VSSPTGGAGEGFPSEGDTTFNDGAAPTSARSPYRGNPLCRVTTQTPEYPPCLPDDDGSKATPSGIESCAAPASSYDDAATTRSACRLSDATGVLLPTCSVTADPAGTDGIACTTGADCAPGFDCVQGEGASICRRYCCMGSCAGQLSQNGETAFCDVQHLVDTGTKAPVCLPIKHCDLFQDGTCASTETCAVVTENGDTGCVAVGPQGVGEDCDELHCAAGLTCIGQAGSRTCYKLCKVSEGCSGALTCTTSTIFKDPQFGVCQ
jgi:hypothetical protein